jgi:hypothetical protein
VQGAPEAQCRQTVRAQLTGDALIFSAKAAQSHGR